MRHSIRLREAAAVRLASRQPVRRQETNLKKRQDPVQKA